MPAIATARWIGFNPLVQEGLKQSRLIGPLATDQGKLKPVPSPVEVMEVKLPEARPIGIVPTDRPGQLLLLLQKDKGDLVGRRQSRKLKTRKFQAPQDWQPLGSSRTTTSPSKGNPRR